MGDQTVGEIFRRAQTMGLVIQKKNVFPYLGWLQEQGHIVCSGGRPQRWHPVDAPHRAADPLKDFSPELALLMGYTNIEPKGGYTVHPLEATAEYSTVSRKKSKVKFTGIQSGLGNVNPLF